MDKKEPCFGVNFFNWVEKWEEEMLSGVKFYTWLGREKRQARKVILNLFWEQTWTLFGEYDVSQVDDRKVNEAIQGLFWLYIFIQRKLYLKWKKKKIYIQWELNLHSWGETKRASCHFSWVQISVQTNYTTSMLVGLKGRLPETDDNCKNLSGARRSRTEKNIFSLF